MTSSESNFAQFDVVTDHSDHAYANSKKHKQDPFASASSATRKKVMQEWKLLERNLPDSIFVRVYENRIDLLRAVIIGAAGTPYHDSLFFFDVMFPTDYPSHPPSVHYNSFGLRLNPNLYANGRVCLSLLNTWTGKKNEQWNPAQSTILQVLLSIQALVLNEKPYFNEPGLSLWPGRSIWEKRSAAYSEIVFVLSCKTDMYLIRRPPKNFESFVANHFRERGRTLLSACRSYVYGRVRVGFYRGSENDSSFPRAGVVSVSEKFKSSMLQLYPELAKAFLGAAAPLGDLTRELSVESTKNEKEKKEKNSGNLKVKANKGGIFKRFFGKIKVILGLENRVHQTSEKK